MKEGKVIVISAPSGCGKSTIIKQVLDRGDVDLHFSVSATNRPPRPGEVDGVSYHFLSTEEFRCHIDAGDFVEWEEVYPGRFYGTLRSEIDDKCRQGLDVILDIDVKGGINVKRLYGDRARTIFIMPPSVDALRERLVGRATDSPEVIEERLKRAAFEISKAPEFDMTIVNDDLSRAVGQTHDAIAGFLSQTPN